MGALCAMLLYEVTTPSSKLKLREIKELATDQTVRIWQGLRLEFRFHVFKIYFPFSISICACLGAGWAYVSAVAHLSPE